MQIHEYEYVTRAEYSPVQKDVEAIIRKAQRIMKEKYDFHFSYELIGSGVFKVLAKKRSLMTSDIVAYGFGHGLSEFILLGVMGLLTYIIVLQAIHSGQTSQLPPLLVSQVNQLTGFAVVMSLFERLVALVLQVLLTAWDFLAVTKHKLSFYFGAILLHATIDFLSGACQLGLVSNILLIELILAIYVLGVGLLTRQIWKKEETYGLI